MTVPPNNAFASAEVISGASGSVAGSTFDATFEATEPAHISSTEQSVWYKWTVPSTGWYKFAIPQALHTYHGVYSAGFAFAHLALIPDGALTTMTVGTSVSTASGQLSPLATKQDPTIAAYLTAAQVYYIKVLSNRDGSVFNTKTVDFVMEWDTFTPPANDNFADAIDLGTLPASVTGTNFDATFEVGSEVKDNTNAERDREQSIWYKFTAPTTGRYYFSIPISSIVRVGHGDATGFHDHFLIMQISSGTTLATYQAGEITSTRYDANDDTDLEVSMFADLTASTVYYIRFYAEYANKTYSQASFNQYVCEFDLNVGAISPPANDNYASPTVLSTTLPGILVAEDTKDATLEATEPDDPYIMKQSIWYSFTPTVTGEYRFRSMLDSMEYTGWRRVSLGELIMSLAPAAGLANHTMANLLPFPSQYDLANKYPESGWQNPSNLTRIATLTSGVEYRLKVSANGGNSGIFNFNTKVMSFDLLWDAPSVIANDDFDDAFTITGSGGTEDLTSWGCTFQVDESISHSTSDSGDGTQTQGTIWYSWTCPTSGWYKFQVEPTELTPASSDLAIYTGTAVDALTLINRVYGGTDPNEISPLTNRTALGINAVEGTTYKIQIATWSGDEGDAAQLYWAPMLAPTGDTAATAIEERFDLTRVDNYGNTANDPPPDALTLLSPHDEWGYDDGQFGKSKWWKFTAEDDVVVRIKATQWADEMYSTSQYAREDYGIIAYKGDDYASLVVAQAPNKDASSVMENVALLHVGGDNTYQSVSYRNYAGTGHASQPNPLPEISLAADETLWLCLFGIYEGADSAFAVAEDAAEFNINLAFSLVPPVNDTLPADLGVSGLPWGYPTYAYYLSKTHWDDGYVSYHKFAGHFLGATTYGATVQTGEPAHAGYGPTRSVWFDLSLTRTGNHKIWVDSPGCVISLYVYDSTPDVATLVLVAEDADSGFGGWPEIIVNRPDDTASGNMWLCVDSTAEINFDVKYEWINDSAVIPANDNFDDAIAFTDSFVVSGTTVGASAEWWEWDTAYSYSGPADTVWYKYTPPASKAIVIDGRILTNNGWDGWVIVDVFTGPDKENLTMVSSDSEGGIFRGPPFPTSTNDPIKMNVTAGTDYYIRVCTETGLYGEAFELWVDTIQAYIDLRPSGIESGPATFTVYLDLRPSSVEVYDAEDISLDEATVYFNLSVTSVDRGPFDDLAVAYMDLQTTGSEFAAEEGLDIVTIPFNLQVVDIHECFFHLEPNFAGAGVRKWAYSEARRWSGAGNRRWTWIEGEGVVQVC